MTPRHATAAPPTTIVFGAFDRHNFGDLLFPHIVAALLPGHACLLAGLGARDLSSVGGHRVQALEAVADEWGHSPVRLIHAGGELLTCSAWEAAVMLLPPEEAQDTIAYLETRPEAQRAWVCRMLGTHALAPYTVPRALFPGATRVIYNAVGGVGLDHANPALRAEVLANLGAADAVGVRDRVTQGALADAGITAQLMPDPAVMVAELFEAPIRARAHTGELAQVLQALPQGYLAVQFSAEWGDDATLAQMAAQLDLVAQSTGLGVALFRAGAAPWHDDLANLQGVAARMQSAAVRVFTSLHVWDICTLIAHSRGYCGSSLHGRIVATAFALPRLSLCQSTPPGQTAKTVAWASTWEPTGLPVAVNVATLADGMLLALAAPRRQQEQASLTLPAHYRQGFGNLCDLPA